MKTVKSLAGTERKYWEVEGTPIRVSQDKLNGEWKMHLSRTGAGDEVRVEDNRVVVMIGEAGMKDLKAVVAKLTASPKKKVGSKKSVKKGSKK